MCVYVCVCLLCAQGVFLICVCSEVNPYLAKGADWVNLEQVGAVLCGAYTHTHRPWVNDGTAERGLNSFMQAQVSTAAPRLIYCVPNLTLLHSLLGTHARWADMFSPQRCPLRTQFDLWTAEQLHWTPGVEGLGLR